MAGEEATAFRGGELLWRARMSVATQVFGWLGLLLGLTLLGVGIAQAVPLFVVLGVPLAWFSLAGSVLPTIEARSTGVYLRNVVHEVWVPWGAVHAVVATTRVNLILDQGAFVGAWAVQKGALASGPARVDVVAQRLESAWNDWRDATVRSADEVVVRRVARTLR